MTVKVMSEQQVIEEGVGVAKVARFLATWQTDGGDYLAIRDRLFADETVETLFEKVQAYQTRRDKHR